ncbi:uncharacterized protein LOC115226579 [Octopus sinensis]|uniref:Uncharacterized protein LOC115226579 n=1 Tax=Octopus sinensis TaxID=2607531 RepID=A0A6P7TN22_9MOLL|nr:uncharacterized protein LOC115226579 [Octopus sinensis]
MEVRNDITDNNEQINVHEYNEIKQYTSCRYVSPPEILWRLSEIKMHGQSHAVYRLTLHLPDEQQVYYIAGEQRQAAARAQKRDTHLTGWFKLNQSEKNDRNLLYCDIPEQYVSQADYKVDTATALP